MAKSGNHVSIAIPFHLKGKASNDAYHIAFNYYSKLPYPVHLCGSEGKVSEAFCRPYLNATTQYREVPQEAVVNEAGGQPVLLRKFNDSLATLPDTEWKCLIGADDIISESFFHQLAQLRFSGPVLCGVRLHELYYLLDLKHGNIKRLEITPAPNQILSSGVSALNRQAMKMNHGSVFYMPGAEIGIDLEMQRRGDVIPLSGWVINVKGSDTLHSFEACLRYNKAFDCNPFEYEFINSVINA